jgi:molecular chaperone DnaK (HSP70)
MHGDTTLGGVDFVRRIMDFCIYEHKTHNKEDILGNWEAIEKLRIQCEKAKRTLSFEKEATILCPRISGSKDF